MKLFIDSADIDEIKEVLSYGILDGVTTNPSLIKEALKKHGNVDTESYIKEILKICKGKSVSLEVVGINYEEMIIEGKILFKKFNKIAKNVYIKIPVNPCLEKSCSNESDGIRAIKTLSKSGIRINCTLIFTPEQALIAAKAGAKIVSPFAGREDDYIRELNRIKFKKEDYFPREGIKKIVFPSTLKVFHDNGIVSGVDLIKKCAEIFRKQKIKSLILAASIRSPRQFREVAEAGADIATLPLSVIKKILEHRKTAEGMRKFTRDVVPEYRNILKKKQ
ncbi:MAG TPA: transaldolase family protein [Candidatus Nanoarchaeia archaeon]|nr:transaldolase family protein [Candidatus Nanoarchaeia archaeon]